MKHLYFKTVPGETIRIILLLLVILFPAILGFSQTLTSMTISAVGDMFVIQKNNFDTAQLHGYTNPEKIDKAEKSKWIAATLAEMKKVKKLDSTQTITMRKIDLEDNFLMSFRVRGSGFISFEDGDWIYLVSHSEHNSEQVGDLTLAIDNHGEIFINDGHVCGGIINFMTKRKIQVKEASHFFGNFISDTDDRGWISLSHEYITTSFTSK